jgi:transcriptional regulator with XRE-family HTH domain
MQDATADFAALLREMKDRSGRSYEALARRSGISSSALHRYCSGRTVPAGYEPVDRLARLCGASPEESLELHRRWAVAASRHTPPAADTPEPDRPKTDNPAPVAPAPVVPVAVPTPRPAAISPSLPGRLGAAAAAAVVGAAAVLAVVGRRADRDRAA